MWHQGSTESDRLSDALYSARRTILSLLPVETRTRLESYYDLKTWTDFHRWEREIVDHFVESARVLKESENSYFGPRACCPLCGSSTSAPYQEGFSLPEGLRRHLTGWGNVQQCDVLEHVFGMALDARREQFDNSRAEEEAQKKGVLAKRREHETLFDLGPVRGVTLIDEGLDFGSEPRDSGSLSFGRQSA
jgi:hypothetical protein